MAILTERNNNPENNDILEILLGAFNDTIKKLDTDTWSRMTYYILYIAKQMYRFKHVLFENRLNFEF